MRAALAAHAVHQKLESKVRSETQKLDVHAFARFAPLHFLTVLGNKGCSVLKLSAFSVHDSNPDVS